MAKPVPPSLTIALSMVAAATLGGCYDGDIRGAGYASSAYACETRYGSGYYDAYDPYAYDDGYGYDCYDGADYGRGFVQIGFGGGWYDDYYYPGYGTWMFDRSRNRYPLSGRYLNYWGGRRAAWMHRQDRPGNGKENWRRPGNGAGPPPVTGSPTRPRPPATNDATPGRPGRGDGSARPGGWNRGDGEGARPARRPDANGVTPPATENPRRPGMMRPRPQGTGEVRPERDNVARPEGTTTRPPAAERPARPDGMARPPVAERPARAPDMARPSAPPRTAPAPTPRSESGRPSARPSGRDWRTRDR